MLLEVMLSFIVKVETLLYYSMLIFWTKLRQIGRLMVAVAWSVVHVMSSLLAMYGLWKWFRLNQAWVIWITFIDKDLVLMVSEIPLVVGDSAAACLSDELIWVRECRTSLLVVPLRRKWLLSCRKRLEVGVAIPTKAVIYRCWRLCIHWHAWTLILLCG